MFESTINHGFNMTFKNGYSISVQWGYGNYCSNKDLSKGYFDTLSKENAIFQGETAEVAIFRDNESVTLDVLGVVDCGWLHADEVADLILKVKNL